MTDRLKPITILMTSVGNDGFPSVLSAVKENGERDVRVVGVDMLSGSAGLYLADSGHVVPPRSDAVGLCNRLMDICREEHVDLIYPLSTDDQDFFAAHCNMFQRNGIKVIVSSENALNIANNKLTLYRYASEYSIPCPAFESVSSFDGFEKAAHSLGYPLKRVVLRCDRGTGSNGLKIIDPHVSSYARFIDRDNKVVSYREVASWLKDMDEWPDMHMVKYLPNKEYSTDVLCLSGETIAAVTRLRSTMLYGLAVKATVVRDDAISAIASDIVSKLGLSYVVNIQFREDENGKPMLMEINPRIPGSIGLTVNAGVNMPYLAVKLALSEPFSVQKIDYGMTMFRHWDMKCVSEKCIIK